MEGNAGVAVSATEQAPVEDKKSRVELRRTPAEMLADSILRQQRIKGRKTYGRGLTHTDDYRWHVEALCELADAVHYLSAENLKLHDGNEYLSGQNDVLRAELDSLRKATLDTAPFIPPMDPAPTLPFDPPLPPMAVALLEAVGLAPPAEAP